MMEWEAEGGVYGRAARYKANYDVIQEEMERMGFEFYVPASHRSFLICTFLVPPDPNFKFQTFYDFLSQEGFVIYPGKLAQGESFRFGTIGRLFPRDCRRLMAAVCEACAKMRVSLPVASTVVPGPLPGVNGVSTESKPLHLNL